MSEVNSSLQKAMDIAEKIGYMKAQNEILHFVWELSKQKRISDEVAHLFAMELSLDLE
jgi:lipopolysaccharide biosynthesis regulator YciM